MAEDKTVEGRIKYSGDACSMLWGFVRPYRPTTATPPKVGDLRLDVFGKFLQIRYTGREDIAREIEEYIRRVNYDGTHEAMMVTLELKARRQH